MDINRTEKEMDNGDDNSETEICGNQNGTESENGDVNSNTDDNNSESVSESRKGGENTYPIQILKKRFFYVHPVMMS